MEADNNSPIAGGQPSAGAPEATEPRLPKAHRRRRRLLRWLLIGSATVVVLAVIGVWYLTSEHFVRHVVVPRIEKRMGREIDFDRLDIRLFRGAEIDGLTIGPAPGQERSLLVSDHLAVRWRFWELVRGCVHLRSLLAENLQLSITEAAQEAKQPGVPEKASAGEQKRPTQAKGRRSRFLIENLKVTSSSIELLRPSSGEQAPPARYALGALAAEGRQIGMGQPMALTLRGRLQVEDARQGLQLTDGAVALEVRAKASATGDAVALDGVWSVEQLRGHFRATAAEDLRASGSLAVEQPDANRLIVRQARMVLFRKADLAAEIEMSADLDRSTGDGWLRCDLRHIDHSFFNLLSKPDQPLDFGNTAAAARVALESSQGGQRVTVDGSMRLTDFSVTAPNLATAATPLTQMSVRYKAAAEPRNKRIQLDRLDVLVLQERREVVRAALTQPITFALTAGGAVAAESPTSLTLKIDRLSLSQFNPFMNPQQLQIAGGHLSVDSNLAVAGDGRSVTASGRVDVVDLRASASGRSLGETDVAALYDLRFRGEAVSIRTLNCQVEKDGRPAGRIEGHGEIVPGGAKSEIVLTGKDIDLSALQVFLAHLSGVRFHAGKINFGQTIAADGGQGPLRFDGRFEAAALTFDLPSKAGARFAGWTVSGDNQIRFDRATSTAELVAFSFRAQESGMGEMRAVGSGQIDCRRGNGQINLDIQEIGVPLLASILERIGAKTDTVAVHPTAGTLSGKTRMQLRGWAGDISAEGDLRTSGLKWSSAETQSQPRAGDLESAYDLALSQKGKQLTIRNVTVRVIAPGGKPGSLRVGGKLDLEKSTGNIDLQLERFDSAPVLAIAGPLLGAWRPVAGVFDGAEQLQLGGRTSRLVAQGQLRAAGLRVMLPRSKSVIEWPAAELKNNVALLRGDDALQIDQFALRSTDANGQAGSLDVNGRIEYRQRSADVTVAAENFDMQSVWPILDALDMKFPVAGGRISGRQQVRLAGEPSMVEAKGNLTAENLRLPPRQGAEAVAPLGFDLDNDLTLTAKETKVRSLVLSTRQGGRALDRIELSAQGGGLRSREVMKVAVRAPALHLDTYLAMLPKRAAGEKAIGSPRPGAPSAKQGGQGPKWIIPGPPVLATVTLGEFHYDRVNARTVVADLGITSQGVTIQSLTAQLADGSFGANGWIRTDVPEIAYSGVVRGENVTASSLLGMIKPGLEEKLSGKGNFQCEFSGWGLDAATMQRRLKGKGSFHITDGEWKKTPILSALATVTTVEHLENVRFFDFSGQWEIKEGVVHIPEAMVTGAVQRLRAKGTVGFDQKVDLQFDLWLGGELVDRLKDKKIFRYLKVGADRFLRLPVPIGMTGTLQKPRPSLELPVEAILDIGVDQGLNLLEEYLKKRKE